MRSLTVVLGGVVLAISPHVMGDVVKIETNNWINRRTLTWTGTLERIDRERQIAYFSYLNHSREERFEVHVTRIYSLSIDGRNRVDRDFPSTIADLKSPLPTNPRSRALVELSNDGFVEQSIPANVMWRKGYSDHGGEVLHVKGRVVSGEQDEMTLEAMATQFPVNRSDVIKWIRGL